MVYLDGGRDMKGNITDTLFIISFVLMFFISLVIINVIYKALSETEYFNRVSSTSRTFLLNVLYGSDYIIPFLFFVFSAISIIAASNLNSKVALYAFVLIFAPICLFFAHFFSDMVKTYISSTELTQYGITSSYFYTNYPLSMFIIDNLFSLTLFVFVGIMVITYIGGRLKAIWNTLFYYFVYSGLCLAVQWFSTQVITANS